MATTESTPAPIGFRSGEGLEAPGVEEQARNDLDQAKKRFDIFNEKLSEADLVGAVHFTQNFRVTVSDARQYRHVLHFLLYAADELVMDFELVKKPLETAPYIVFLDAQIERLQRTFDHWFGSSPEEISTKEVLQRAVNRVKVSRLYGRPGE